MAFYDLTEFIKLSAAINYQLVSRRDCCLNIMFLILDEKKATPASQRVLNDVLHYLMKAYGERQRRLGPVMVLHPIRATAILARSLDRADLSDLVTELLHDKEEDIKLSAYPEDVFGHGYFVALEENFQELLKRIDPDSDWNLPLRLDYLSRRAGETYYGYIGRLLECAHEMPELVRVKLADRLDNTLDLHIDFRDPLDATDFFEYIFQVLFVPNAPPPKPDYPHQPPTAINGAQRLYQLFKNAILLSLIRQSKTLPNDPSTQHLFETIAIAGMREAQRIAMHIFLHHYELPHQQRELLMETMHYCQTSGISEVTTAGTNYRLDGLFKEFFDHDASDIRKQHLDVFYEDKPLMIEAAMAFIVIFQSFLSDPAFYIRGISAKGIQPPC